MTPSLKEKHGGVLIPKGAAVTGPIVGLERVYEAASQSLILAITAMRWQGNTTVVGKTGCVFIKSAVGRVINAVHDWMDTQFAEQRAEPNSSLGKAISYISAESLDEVDALPFAIRRVHR